MKNQIQGGQLSASTGWGPELTGRPTNTEKLVQGYIKEHSVNVLMNAYTNKKCKDDKVRKESSVLWKVPP